MKSFWSGETYVKTRLSFLSPSKIEVTAYHSEESCSTTLCAPVSESVDQKSSSVLVTKYEIVFCCPVGGSLV